MRAVEERATASRRGRLALIIISGSTLEGGKNFWGRDKKYGRPPLTWGGAPFSMVGG